MKIALLQMSCTKSKDENVQKAVRYMKEASDKGADIICFQELFSTIYFAYTQDPAFFEYAEKIPGPTTEKIAKACNEYGIAAITPIFELDSEVPGLYYNTAVVLDRQGKMLGKYRKTHLPQLPGYDEKYYFRPGNTGYPVFEVNGHKIGVYICYDRHFPEGPRIMALKGAEIIFIPTCTGVYPELWELELRAHASFNTVYVAGVNRVGKEYEGQQHPYYGSTAVVDPSGKIVAKASDKEELLIFDADIERLVERRRQAPFLRDRRPELYGKLAEFA